MRRCVVILCVSLGLAAPTAVAADFSVNASTRVDFTGLKTFAVREGRIESSRPEFDNELFARKLNATVRAALTSRGLAERPGGPPDLTVDYRFTTEDVHTIGIRPRGPLRFTAGMLVIDLHVPGENDPVWRGVYRDEDEASTKLVQRFLKGAEKLVARYPKLK